MCALDLCLYIVLTCELIFTLLNLGDIKIKCLLVTDVSDVYSD